MPFVFTRASTMALSVYFRGRAMAVRSSITRHWQRQELPAERLLAQQRQVRAPAAAGPTPKARAAAARASGRTPPRAPRGPFAGRARSCRTPHRSSYGAVVAPAADLAAFRYASGPLPPGYVMGPALVGGLLAFVSANSGYLTSGGQMARNHFDFDDVC